MAISWGTFDDPFLAELRDWIGGRRVLEVFAGNGLLASKLEALGVPLISTSLFSGHDGHRDGMFHPVVEMDSEVAVARFGAVSEVLLMSWPVVSEAALRAAAAWGTDRPIVYIGEVTDLAHGQLGGCASDLFFELTEERERFAAYRGRSGYERAGVRYTLPTAGKRLEQERADKGPRMFSW